MLPYNVCVLTYKFRLYPKKGQISAMEKWLEECRMLYNNFLAERKNGWEKSKKSFTLYTQLNRLPKLKKTYPGLKSVYSQVLQNVGMRVDLAYRAFFRRIGRHKKPGYPRFKSFGRYDSFCYPCCVSIKMDDGFISLPKIGKVAWIKHREITGKLKTVTVKRSRTGKWYCYIVTDAVKVTDYGPSDKFVGIDVGITTFATLSNGEDIPNPRFFEVKQKQLAKKNRAFQRARDKKFGVAKTKRALQKVHEKIANCRHNFAHQTANKLVRDYGTLCVEDIEANSLIRKHWCSKQILDAAWGNFNLILAHKAECAGRKLIKVNPAYTSQTCSSCGSRTVMELKDRVFNCPCGYTEGRDRNAAHNILALGLQSLAETPRSSQIYSGE